MKRIVLAVAGAALMLPLAVSSSYAFGNAPWCAVINIGVGEMYWDCQYQTAEQCFPNVIAGNRGFCNVNPYNVAQAYPPEPMHRARRPAHRHSVQ